MTKSLEELKYSASETFNYCKYWNIENIHLMQNKTIKEEKKNKKT